METPQVTTQTQAKQKKYVYTSKFTLDEQSYHSLKDAAATLTKHDIPTSQNVLIRRALRLYAASLRETLTDEAARNAEATAILRASKGGI